MIKDPYFSFFPLYQLCVCVCVIFMLGYVPFIPSFLRGFMMKGCWICQGIFLYLLRWWCDFCPLFYVCAILHLLISEFEPSLHAWSETNLIMVYDLFNVFLNLVCKYFIENFCIYVHQGNWCNFFCHVLILFWYQGTTGFIEWVW
jgi:hypothetical protein